MTRSVIFSLCSLKKLTLKFGYKNFTCLKRAANGHISIFDGKAGSFVKYLHVINYEVVLAGRCFILN